MGFNNNSKTLPYVSSDLQKQKVVVPPRNKKREIDLIIYSTNQTTDVIINNTSNLAIQAKLETQLKLNPTTPVGGSALKPKFGNVGETEAYRTQINGFVYEEIPFDNATYVFATQNLATSSTIGNIQKFRIINYQPVFNNGKFLYAEVSLLPETILTIQSLKKLNWNLVQSFQADVKTKYLKLELPSRFALLPNGLKISIKPEKTDLPRNDGYIINSLSEDLVLKLIKVRQTGPIEFDDLTLSDFKDRDLGSNLQNGYAFAEGFSGAIADINQLEASVTTRNDSPQGSVRIVNQLDYFSKGLKITQTSRIITIKENLLSQNDVKAFLNGTFSIDNQLLEKDKNLSLDNTLKKLSDLDINSSSDKKYFVLTYNSDLTKYLDKDKRIVQTGRGSKTEVWIKDKVPFPKSRLLNQSEWGSNFLSNDPIIIELELQAEGFSPKIEIDTFIADNIKITQYDANHQIIGTPNLSFATESVFDDSKTTTTIQL